MQYASPFFMNDFFLGVYICARLYDLTRIYEP